MNSKIAIVFGLLALLGAVSVSASDFEDAIDFESDAIHRTAVAVDGFDANPYFTNNIAEDEAFFASASSRSLQKTTTCSNPSAATDIYILDANKATLWCAYNDTLIVKMTNNPTNQALDVCKWRWVYCYGATTYTLIYQGISGTNKFLYCQTTGTYDFCGKMVMSDALTDLGQFWIRTNAFALDTLYNNFLSKYASNSNGMLATNVNAYYFKMCEPAYLGSC